ncbi:SemiSWEET transporter [Flammeovirgaceae bacterium SG7u.111]|nr:SemiSWEET transporter [Flammeovirgaceae bacterium SG7u.132]WPO38369.1 SemiSWEET transporter [Flammeovirgaceae bacterium SG7u.111]
MENFGIIAAVLTTGAYLPQALKTIKTGNTESLSLTTFSMMFIGTICWSTYGLYIGDVPLLIANVITTALSGVILTMKVRSKIAKRQV